MTVRLDLLLEDMKLKNIVLIGSSGHAKVVIDIVERQGKYRLVGLIDDFREIGERTLNYSILGSVSDLPKVVRDKDIRGVIVAIGDNYVRATLEKHISRSLPNLPFITAIHPSAEIGRDVIIGPGTVMMAGTVINACSRVGKSCFLNTKASLGHDCDMDDYSSLGPGVTVGGGCRVGAYSSIGIGANVRHGIEIGTHCVIGGGALVVDPIESFSVSFGVPARFVRKREPQDKYL